MVEWSIIIPTLNEEKYLPKLLDSIEAQDFDNYEIIVVDSESDDNTVGVARDYGCRVLKGQRGIPSINRNIGAKHARGKNLIFFDADVVLPNGFLRDNTSYFEEKGFDVAGGYSWPVEKSTLNNLLRLMVNTGLFLSQYIKPAATGCCIFAKKSLHEKFSFDESLKFFEDATYVETMVRNDAKFGLLRSPLEVSMRRFDKYGPIKTSIKSVRLIMESLLEKKQGEYEFGDY